MKGIQVTLNYLVSEFQCGIYIVIRFLFKEQNMNT